MERFAVVNGLTVPEAEALLPAASPAVLFGAGVFDTLKCGPGRIYWLDEHIRRFLSFAKTLSIPVARTAREIHQDALTCLAANPWGPPSLKLIAALVSEERADCFVVVSERTAYADPLYEEGARLAVSPVRQHERSALSGKKTLNYFERYLARREAARKEILDWLYLDTQGHVAEGTFLNLFWVRGGTIHTPALSTGVLPGITRGIVLAILRREGFRVEEGADPLEHLLTADEAFATSSVLEVAPVVRIDDYQIGDGLPGKLTRQVIRWYRHERNEKGTVTLGS